MRPSGSSPLASPSSSWPRRGGFRPRRRGRLARQSMPLPCPSAAEGAPANIMWPPRQLPAAAETLSSTAMGRLLGPGGALRLRVPLGCTSALQRCCRSSSCGRRGRLAPGFHFLASYLASSRPVLRAASGSRPTAAAAGPHGSHWRSPQPGAYPWPAVGRRLPARVAWAVGAPYTSGSTAMPPSM